MVKQARCTASAFCQGNFIITSNYEHKSNTILRHAEHKWKEVETWEWDSLM